MASSTAEQLCRRFSLTEIKLATGDFSNEHVIGTGGFGKVYKGVLEHGPLLVAVKRLASNSRQGAPEFAAEMETLSKLRHRNLVSLIGYCHEQGEMILVYEYMPNGTLADHLHNSNNHCSSLTWNERLRICIGAARGLDYLHTGSSVIHRDVKPTNILLDENLTAKVSDFGLAKHLSGDDLETHVSASIKGSFGYFDPSYFISGRLTKASDTYSFGVVLLEVLSGRPAIDRKLDEGYLCLTMWAQERIRNGKFHQIVASTLRAEISEDCLKTFVGVVKGCLHQEPKKRLSMTQAVAQLEFALERQERKGPQRKLQFPSFNVFWNRVMPSGSTQKENNEVEGNLLPGDALPRKENISSVDESEEQNVRESFVVPAIPLDEMKDLTDDFSSKCWIANGITGGSIFHGVLKTGQNVAVKRHYKKFPNQDFLAQVALSSKLKHQNVIELLGYCVEGGLQVLLYEFATEGSLHDILHGRQGPTGLPLEPGPTLSWAQRVKIAIGAAKGLLYYHEKSLIHRNIKSSNILLFEGDIAKITDSHLSTACPCKDDSVDVRVIWDCGHHSPEYGSNGYTQAGDVYNFGVVLLELLTGRKPNVRNEMQMITKSNLLVDIDGRLKGDYSLNLMAAEKMAEIALECAKYGAEYRPKMSLVFSALETVAKATQI